MKSPLYILGFVLGLAVGLGLVWLVLRRQEKKAGRSEYDERQRQARDGCYKTAFWTLSFYMLLNGVFVLLTGREWADAMTASFVGFCLAATVFVVLCIRRDAYFGINDSSRFYVILFSVVMAVNALVLTLNIVEGEEFLTDGKLNYHCINGVIMVMFAAVLIALGLRRRRERMTEE